MSKKLLLSVVAVFFFMSMALYSPREASAIPAFARQTGMACNSCHFQHFPSLNAFGRAFKAGGYTQIGGQSLVEGEHLSIPVTLNASLVTKIRYQKRNGSTTTGDAGELNKGQLQFPDEAAFLIGGRAGEHVGFLLEASLKDGDPLFTSFKMPITFDVHGVNLSAIPFLTDSAGASYGFETFNTGALRMARPFEHRTQTSAQQYIGTDGKATGLALVASHSMGFVNYTPFVREHPSSGTNGNTVAAGPYLNYFRGAVTPTVAGWDLGAGFQVWNGTSKSIVDASGVVREHADAWALDAQAQGEVAGLPLGLYATYAVAKKSEAGKVANVYNTNTFDDKTAWTLTGELGVIPHRLTVGAAYRGGHTGASSNDSDNATTLAFVYEAAQNVEFQLNHSWLTGDVPSTTSGKNLTTLMLFAAF
ncbi:MAG: hypothetical protein HYS21_10070 [Deltaproteobacteria bacterium]|nr:hypothetical protein [Deltaproteobacteria bacterium]